MNKKLFNTLLFTTGAAIGSLVTWKVVKTKYERILQEEIDSFKESYVFCMRGQAVKDDSCDISEDGPEADDYEDPVMIDYRNLAARYNKSGEETENGEEGEGDEEVPYINGPYVIPPEDFADGNYDHDIYSLTYYSDGVLANDWDEKLDIDETIGLDSLEHFGDHVEDVVHVRNERLNADYEVVRDTRTYDEILALHSPGQYV